MAQAKIGSGGDRFEQVDFPDSLGFLYSAVTGYLGFEVNEGEYKVMGLSAFGTPRFRDEFGKLLMLRADGSFQPVLDDPTLPGPREDVTRLVLCSGKVYYDIVGHEDHEGASSVAVARLEQLYPFPVEQAAQLVRGYPNLREVVWAQEEPQNMGPWRSIRHRLEEAAAGGPLRFVGRPWRASPSEGYPTAHGIEQDRIARAALTL